MTDLVLCFVSQFGKSLFVPFGLEYRVITEAGISALLFDDFPFDHTFKEIFLSVENQRNGSAELRFPILFSFQFVEQLAHIRLSIVAFAFGITGGVHAGRSVQSFHFQSGVIGKAVQLIVPVDKRRFQQGISFQRFGCFGDVRVAVNVIQTEQFYLIPKDSGYFFELMSIVSGKYKFAFHGLILVF